MSIKHFYWRLFVCLTLSQLLQLQTVLCAPDSNSNNNNKDKKGPVQSLTSFLEKEEHKREYQTTLQAERFGGSRRRGAESFFAFLKRLQHEHFGDVFEVQYDPKFGGVEMHEQKLLDTADKRMAQSKVKVRWRQSLETTTTSPEEKSAPSTATTTATQPALRATGETDMTAKKYFLDPQLASAWRWRVPTELPPVHKARSKVELDFFLRLPHSTV